jgi:hypothetical protein
MSAGRRSVGFAFQRTVIRSPYAPVCRVEEFVQAPL